MSALSKLTAIETKLVLRDRVSVLLVLGLPVLIIVLFGSITKGSGDQTVGALFPAMGISLALGALGLNLLPSYLATYREKGILRRLAATPIHPSKLLVAQFVVNLMLAVVGAALVVLIGRLAFGFPFPASVGYTLLAFALGTLSLFAVGLFVAALAPSGRGASGIGMLLWIGSLFFGGVFMPKEQLPEVISRIGDFTPLGAALQSFRNAWVGDPPQLLHLIVMAGIAVVFGFAAARLFRWE